jgi:hypothetical protein
MHRFHAFHWEEIQSWLNDQKHKLFIRRADHTDSLDTRSPNCQTAHAPSYTEPKIQIANCNKLFSLSTSKSNIGCARLLFYSGCSRCCILCGENKSGIWQAHKTVVGLRETETVSGSKSSLVVVVLAPNR